MNLERILKTAREFAVKNKRFCISSALLVGASILDAYATSQGVQKIGIDREVNMFVQYFLQNIGPGGVYFFKLLAVPPFILLSRLENKNIWLDVATAGSVYGAASWYIW